MLINELKLKQGQLSDYQFAAELGMSHQLWQMTRTGKRDIGLAILKAITRAYPELDRDVLLFLRGDVVRDAENVGYTTTPPQTAQNGFSARFKNWCGGVVLRAKKMWHNSRKA